MTQKLPLSYSQHSSRQLLEVSNFVASSYKRLFSLNMYVFKVWLLASQYQFWSLFLFLGTNENIMLPTGATVCVELKKFEEAITWCDKGLAVSFEKSSVLIS